MFSDKKGSYIKILWGISIFILQIIVIQIIAFFPDKVTVYYTQGIYYYISDFQQIIFGFVGFCLGDLIYAVLIVLFVIAIIYLVKNRLRNRKSILYKFIVFINLFYALFNLFWGLNYYKQPFLEQFNIQKQQSTNQDLFELTEFVIQKTNQLREKTHEDKEGIFKNKASFDKTIEKVIISYHDLCKKLNIKSHKTNPLFISWYSEWISYLGIGGYYNPFFGTAQINGTILPHDYGMTISHEIAHQYGFASEKEANYIAFLNNLNSQDSDLQYSAYYNTLWYLLYEVYKIDFERFEQYKALLSVKVQNDRKADRKYYEKYHGNISHTFSKANNLYLKANKQEGIETYSYYVQLVLNQFLSEKKETAGYYFLNDKI
ncbi:MAG: DUF3810 domain-containing protein [Flavobacteriales bacterium]